VKRYLQSGSALGQVGRANPRTLPRYTIIGVVADSKYTGVRESDTPIASLPYQQALEVAIIHYDMSTKEDPARFLPVVSARAIREFAPDLQLEKRMTQPQQFDTSISSIKCDEDLKRNTLCFW
jgi:hypothetical protein